MSVELDPYAEWSLLGCWLLFVVTWIGGWIYNAIRAPKVVRRHLSPMLLVDAAIVWIATAIVPQRFWDALTVDSQPLRECGIVVLVAGTCFAIWARVTLGRMWTGIPSIRFGHTLCTGGPFAIVRHPIYIGVIAMLAGTAMIYGFGTWTAPAVVALLGLSLKVRVEERLLRETFGERYDAYCSSVPVVPLVRPRAARRAYQNRSPSQPASSSAVRSFSSTVRQSEPQTLQVLSR